MMTMMMMMMVMDDFDVAFAVASAPASAYCGSNQSATRCNKAADYSNSGPLPANPTNAVKNHQRLCSQRDKQKEKR